MPLPIKNLKIRIQTLPLILISIFCNTTIKNLKYYEDKAYTDYAQEDLLQEACEIQLIPKRKKNAKRQNNPSNDFLLSLNRNKIETVFNVIVNLMPRCIRAVTPRGFCLKIFFFIFGYTVNRMLPSA